MMVYAEIFYPIGIWDESVGAMVWYEKGIRHVPASLVDTLDDDRSPKLIRIKEAVDAATIDENR